MKGFIREYPLFALCGLNCGLCTMHIGGYCPGCGGGEGNQGCAVARCAIGRGVEFCSHCGDYPCARYEGIDAYDSFISHRNQKRDLEKLRRIGLEAYQAELGNKMEQLRLLLNEYNDGRRKTLFSTAVNLLELEALQRIVAELAADADGMTVKEKAALASKKLEEAAEEQGISLKLRNKK